MSEKLRYAVIHGARSADEVAAYLPTGYHVFSTLLDHLNGRLQVTIRGVDQQGWTLDDYVLPRLASGMLFGEERPVPADAAEYAEEEAT
jgi:hypothetical protein